MLLSTMAQEALVNKAGDLIRSMFLALCERNRAIFFKQVPGGYVFRAPNPRLVGRADHYLVSQAQQDEIDAILTPRRPFLALAVWIIAFLALVASLAWFHVSVAAHPTTGLVVLLVVLFVALPVAILVLHMYASRKLRRLQPVLAGAPLTDQRITRADMSLFGRNKRLSYRQLLDAGVGSACVCLCSVVGLVITRHQNVQFFSDPLPLIFLYPTTYFGFQSITQFLAAWQKIDQTERTSPGSGSFLTRSTRFFVLTSALALLGLAGAVTWVGVERAFSDHSQGLRYEAKGEHDNAITSFSKPILDRILRR
jgi:hypothetical protein